MTGTNLGAPASRRLGAPASRRLRNAGGTPALPAVVLLLLLAGCWRGATSPRPPWHPNPNMDHQPKYRPQAASAFFYDGATMRPPVPGTVARGELHEDAAFYTGLDAAGAPVAKIPIEVDEALIERGRERYTIYCAPCHTPRGNGKGILWQRANIPTADLHQQRLREAPDGQLFDVVTNGLGLMSGYKYPIPADDRWAIIAYVRQLQNEAGP